MKIIQLFNIDDDGDLIKVDKLDFNDDHAYLVDDGKIIYLWIGLETSQNKKEVAANIARRLENERINDIKILIMKQKREYGSFLVMMDQLKKGILPGETIERRPELKLGKPPNSIESEAIKGSSVKKEPDADLNLIEKSQQPESEMNSSDEVETEEVYGLEKQIREAAYYLSLAHYSYNDLCWMLAEKILQFTVRMPSIEDTKKKAEEVFNSSCTYDELCWLNSEMDLLIRKEYLVKEPFNFNQ